jgi:hypothetical protein
MEDKSRNTKLLIGLCLSIPWLLYQFSPLFKGMKFDLWQTVFTTMVVIGIIVIATIKQEKKEIVTKIKAPRLK